MLNLICFRVQAAVEWTVSARMVESVCAFLSCSVYSLQCSVKRCVGTSNMVRCLKIHLLIEERGGHRSHFFCGFSFVANFKYFDYRHSLAF